MNRCVALILWLLLAMPFFGAGKTWTQAETMGFNGPIKAASTTIQTFMERPGKPGGPSVIYPLFCGECEFDRDGKQVRSGWMENGQFRGSVMHTILDGVGRVREEISENEKGEVTSRHWYAYGPAGKTQDNYYLNGNLITSSTFTYDNRGNVIEWDIYKPDGTLQYHQWSTFDERGDELESVSEGLGDIYYDFIRTYNPRTGHLESFTSLNRNGSMRLSYRVNDDTVLSYWQQPGDKPTSGSGIWFSDDNGTERVLRLYNWDGTYTTTHDTFTDKTKRTPVKVTLHDTDHQLVMEADYEYEMDAFGNWKNRTIWVRIGESGERKLLEKDVRTLTYYSTEAPRP